MTTFDYLFIAVKKKSSTYFSTWSWYCFSTLKSISLLFCFAVIFHFLFLLNPIPTRLCHVIFDLSRKYQMQPSLLWVLSIFCFKICLDFSFFSSVCDFLILNEYHYLLVWPQMWRRKELNWYTASVCLFFFNTILHCDFTLLIKLSLNLVNKLQGKL